MEDKNNIQEFIRRAVEKIGFNREKYIESKLPTNFSQFLALPFFGDKKHEFVLATMLFNRLKEKYHNKYFIVCGWPGHNSWFQQADEYWSIKEDIAKSMLPQAFGWSNLDPKTDFYDKQLNRYFETMAVDDLKKYYDNGLTSKFFDEFKFVSYFLPGQPSPNYQTLSRLSQKKGFKIFVYPNRKLQGWRRGKLELSYCKIEFWEKLLENLFKAGHIPIVYSDEGTYDLSSKYNQECIFVGQQKLLDLFGIMHACHCVLDVFSGISRWAIAARTPFIYMTERHIHTETKEFEIDDLCASQIPYRYIFSYTTMIEGIDYLNLVDTIKAKINDFVPEIDQSRLPHTTELSVVAPYMLVRENKAKRFGMKFFKVNKI